MSLRKARHYGQVLLAVAVLLLSVGSASAYVGPGADLVNAPYFWSFIAYCLTAMSAVLLWPVYAIIRKIRGVKNPPALVAPPQETPVESRIES